MPLERLYASWKSLGPLGRLAAVVWAALVVGTAARAGVAPHRHSVYPIFAAAGREWAAGEGLYREGMHPFRYSPAVAAFFAPLAVFPDGAGGALWRLLGAAAFLGGLAWCGRAVLPPPRRRGALFLLLVAPPALSNLNNGQANLHVLGLLLIAAAALRTERFALAAACVAAASLFKLYPVAVGMLFVVLYPRSFGPRLAAALAVGSALPFALQAPGYVAGQYAGWLDHLGHNERQHLTIDLWYRDFRLLWSRWFAPMSYAAYAAVQSAAGAGMALLVFALRRAGVARGRLLGMALGLGCCWMTALGPATESATYVLLAPVGAWLALAPGTPRVARLGYGLLLAAQVASTTPWGRAFHALGPQPLGGLFLSGALVAACARSLAAARRCRRGPHPLPYGCAPGGPSHGTEPGRTRQGTV